MVAKGCAEKPLKTSHIMYHNIQPPLFDLHFGTLTLICALLMLSVEPKLWFWWCEEENSAAARDVMLQPFPPQCFLRSVGWMKCERKGGRERDWWQAGVDRADGRGRRDASSVD